MPKRRVVTIPQSEGTVSDSTRFLTTADRDDAVRGLLKGTHRFSKPLSLRPVAIDSPAWITLRRMRNETKGATRVRLNIVVQLLRWQRRLDLTHVLSLEWVVAKGMVMQYTFALYAVQPTAEEAAHIKAAESLWQMHEALQEN